MVQTIFEEMGGTYTQYGDYLLPNLVLPQEEEVTEPIGAWENSIWLISSSKSGFSTPIC